MKHKISALSLIATLCCMVFVGCKKEEMTEEINYSTIITVKSSNAKTHYNSDTHGVEWDEGDQISVINGNSSDANHFTPFTIIWPVKNGEARFGSTATLPSTSAYYAIYPAQEDLFISESRLSCVANQPRQTLTSNSFGQDNNTAVGWNSSTTMQFRNVGGLAKIAVRGTAMVKSIKIENLGDDTLSGRGTIDVMSENLKIVWDADNSSKEVVAQSADPDNGLSVSGGKIFYIALPPCTLDNYTVTITDVDGNEHSKAFTTPVTITRANVTLLGAFEVNEIIPASNEFFFTANGDDIFDYILQGQEDFDRFFADGVTLDLDRSTYNPVTHKGKAVFTGTITRVPAYALYEQNITDITLPSTITSFGAQCFAYSQLEKITIAENITYINQFAFWYADNLKKVIVKAPITTTSFYITSPHIHYLDFPATLTTIDNSLTLSNMMTDGSYPESFTIILRATTSPVSFNAISTFLANIAQHSSLHIYVPSALVNSYKTAYPDLQNYFETIPANLQ